jgi:TolB-like protein
MGLSVAGSNKAVFLSYAKQDAEAAGRICDALRAAGIEVWFDQSELRGGDAWDAAIRRQIKTCALLIPVISANTQGRAEGYFRLEWKLAVDRSHLMSHDRAFLVPVVIDQTAEDDERVPDKFREVQWTRLPGGETPPAFSTRLLKLLEQDATVGGTAPAVTAAAAARAPAAAAEPAASSVAAPVSKSRTPLIAAAAAALICLGIAAWATRHSWMHTASVVAYSNEDRRMTYAVLPFQAAADDAHGVQIAKATGDEILSILESRREIVSVAPQASAQEAAAHEAGMRKLSRTLDVHFLVRGTVARSGDTYKVTVLGIDGDSERVLTTKTLSVAADALTPRWRDDVGEVVGELIYTGVQTEVKRARSKPADALDVRDLAFRASVDWGAMRDKDGKTANSTANDLLNKALAISPDDPYALRTVARINLCDCVNAWSPNPDEQKAIGAAALDKYLRLDPNSSAMLLEKANLYQLRLRWEESLVIADTVLAHEPESAEALGTKAAGLLRMGRLKEAQDIMDGLLPRSTWWGASSLAGDIAFARGDYARAAQLSQKAVAQMSEPDLRDRVDGSIRLTLIASEARLGHAVKAKSTWADFTTTLPEVTTIAAIKKWMHPSADLADFEPLYEGLRMAGVSN